MMKPLRSRRFVPALGLLVLLGLASCGVTLEEEGKGGTEGGFAVVPQSGTARRARKVIVEARTGAPTGEALRRDGALLDEIDYGSFRLLLVDAARTLAAPLAPHDEMDRVTLGAFTIHTHDPAGAYGQLPPALRRPQVARALQNDLPPPAGLYVVQFVGPVKDEWLGALREVGADVVTYVPENAYVVRVGEAGARGLGGLLRERRFVQFVGAYEPGFRLSPSLLQRRAEPGGEEIDLTVQLLAGPGAAPALAALRGLASWVGTPVAVLGYLNVPLRLPAARLDQLAHVEGVFAVEERTPRQRLDEVQGQIVAGNLSGNSPSGPGYLAWLEGKGFGAGQFGTFAVNVVDDAYSLSGHEDLPAARIAFQHNPTNQTGAQGGHGFLNSHIVGGFNNQSGTAYTDAGGYRYGLGIAPWARVGVTAIFGGGAASAADWERAAYNQGARISTNSWGYTGASARRYDSNAQQFDAIVRDADAMTAGLQQLTVIFAAGNSGSGSNTVSSPGTAKNIISVAAGENVRQTGSDGCGVPNAGADSANDIIGFSSRGPVNPAGGDGRVKPDITAPGTHVQAGIPQSNYDGSSVCNQYWPPGQTRYAWSSGTSHSTPAIAGGAALVYQYFLNQGWGAPSPAMLKAYLLNSASHMTGTGANDTLPSNSQGMGRMNLGRAFDGVARVRLDQTQVLGATGQTYVVSGNVAAAGQPFRVTLAWTDAPGPTTGAPWVNNLDLEVTVGGQTYRGNVFSGAHSVPGGTADGKNNVESVFLPAASGAFTVTVRAANIAGDGVPGNADTTDQDFALLIYNGNAGGPTPEPTIGVSPASLSFTGVQGGANPASQTLSISNTGGGTLNWSATDNAAWLSVSPASGTAPSSVTVSASTAGLAAGTYDGTITVAAAGATNSPVTVPVTLTVTGGGGGGGQLIQNGGFETSAAPWVLAGQAYHTTTGAYPRSGSGYVFMGAANSATGTTYQQVTIPAGASAVGVTFWLNVTTSETTRTTVYDQLFVEVRSTSGALLGTVANFSNLNQGAAGAYVQRGPYNLSAFRGQTVRLQFRATTDSSLITTFRIDDVAINWSP